MMHSEIDREEIIERYVLGQLAPEERQAFEEHFFACDQCFQKVQDVERFRAGVRDAASRGLLNEESDPAIKVEQTTWFRWAFGATAFTTAVLALITGWIQTKEIPRLRQALRSTTTQLGMERQARSQLEQNIASANGAEPNVPLIMLQASRAAEKPNIVALATGAKRLIVWIEIGPTRFHSFRMEVFASGDRPILSLDHLEQSSYGALSASLPAEQLPHGDLRIILTGQNPPPASLVGEYRLKIEKQ